MVENVGGPVPSQMLTNACRTVSECFLFMGFCAIYSNPFYCLIKSNNFFFQQRRVKSCENCAALFSDEGHVSLGGDGSVSFKTSVKVVDTEQRLRELELELAQTKLSLVETECRSQELEHRLTAIMASAEENKPWFKRISLVKDSAK